MKRMAKSLCEYNMAKVDDLLIIVQILSVSLGSGSMSWARWSQKRQVRR